MSVDLITLVILLSLLVLLLTGLPVAFCLIGLSVVGYIVFIDPSIPYTFYSVTLYTLIKDVYIAIPLFIFMAVVLQFSGLATALYDMMYKWFAGLRGGLAMGTVIICTIIAAMTGIGATGTVTMGMLAYPEMRRRGYDKMMAMACIPFGGALGPLIPPSVLMIIVGGYASLSVGKLFMGGVFPGILMAVMAVIYIGLTCFLRPELGPSIPPGERSGWREKFVSLRGVALPILLILLVLGSIYAGVATPTEGGGIGAFGALLCAAVYRRLSWANLKQAAITTLRVNAMVMFLLVGGACFTSLCGITGVSAFVRDLLIGMAVSPIVIVIVMMVIVFVMGMFIDGAAITMICIPIFMPVILQIGIDPLWFGLLFTICAIIGFITPPFGVNLFYFKGLGHPDVSMMDVYRSVTPYVIIMTIVLILCIVFPPILLWLPNMMIK